MKVASCVGVISSGKQIHRQTRKCWCAHERGRKTRPELQNQPGDHHSFDQKCFATGTTRILISTLYVQHIWQTSTSEIQNSRDTVFPCSQQRNGEITTLRLASTPLGNSFLKLDVLVFARKQKPGEPFSSQDISRSKVNAGTPEHFVCQLSGHNELQNLSM